MSQSTSDVYPTALRVNHLLFDRQPADGDGWPARGFRGEGGGIQDILKIGRTQLQDAVPMTLGRFSTYAVMLGEDEARLHEAIALIREINLGATAIGTGINTDIRYAKLAIRHLSELSGLPLGPAPNLIEATQDCGAFVQLSGVLEAHRQQAVEDLQRPAPALFRTAGRPNEIRLPPRRRGFVDHAGQGQSGDSGW